VVSQVARRVAVDEHDTPRQHEAEHARCEVETGEAVRLVEFRNETLDRVSVDRVRQRTFQNAAGLERGRRLLVPVVLGDHIVQVWIAHRCRERPVYVLHVVSTPGRFAAQVHVREGQLLDRLAAEVVQVDRGLGGKPGRASSILAPGAVALACR